jgi:hypothetical protein
LRWRQANPLTPLNLISDQALIAAHLSQERQTPDRAIYFFSALVALLSLTGGFVFLAEVGGLGSAVLAVLTVFAFIILRRRGHGGKKAGFSPLW